MAEEVDQTSVDVIKILLESENGKAFFKQYLAENLKISISSYSEGLINVSLLFNGMYFTSASFQINLKVTNGT